MEEKHPGRTQAALFTGHDSWTSEALAEEGIPSLRFSDGPHGLRIEAKNGFGFNESLPSIAYPTASATACSFDRELQKELGRNLAEECRNHHVNVLLGPGLNHKRSPLCGRNFEYYSEDPYLSGELAASYVEGVQSQGVGACLKHFAGNSREYGRLVEDSIIDERALHELYLSQFERAVKKSNPYTMMCAYNRLNGTYCCEHEALMNIARSDWGFDGLFVSDWGAAADPVCSIQAGLNLEMPGGDHGSAERILSAIDEGTLDVSVLKRNTERFRQLAERTAGYYESSLAYDHTDHSAFALKAAEESSVLMKNDGALPVESGKPVLLIGPFAKHPRMQGTGSSKVNASVQDCLYDVMKENRVPFTYAQGFTFLVNEPAAILEETALFAAKQAHTVIVMAGVPEGNEAEGYDRTDMNLLAGQNRLIEKLCDLGKEVIVVLQCGAPVLLPWKDRVSAILCMYLAGCRSGQAAYDLLFGKVNPSGKLAETWPARMEEVPCHLTFHDHILQVQYRESLYSGYRYYDAADIEPAFPFGHGCSYTAFAYHDLKIQDKGETAEVSVHISNVGNMAGAEAVQLYTALPESRIARPVKELKGFEKIFLEPGETGTVRFLLDSRSFSYYDVKTHRYETEDGTYSILIGSSSRDIRLSGTIRRTGTKEPFSRIGKGYLKRNGDGILDISKTEFEAVLGRVIPPVRTPRPYTVNSTIHEMSQSKAGNLIRRAVTIAHHRMNPSGVTEDMIFESPLRQAFWLSRRITWDTVDAIADYFNGTGSIREIRRTLKKR